MEYLLELLLFLLPVLSNASFRIVGGREIEISEAPYIARLYNPSNEKVCGATIIHPTILVTAAQCTNFTIASTIKIRVGSKSLDKASTDVYTPRRIFVHKSFNLENLAYDIAIIQLNKKLIYSNSVQPARLPEKNEPPVSEGTVGIVSGWGTITHGSSNPSNVLKQTKMMVLSPTECAERMRYASRGIVPESVFCAAGKNYETSTCVGDSGGPFVVDGVLRGVISGSWLVRERQDPVQFTSISYFRDFIDKKLVLT